ncbi:hypothetical protein [Streptomyces noursei]|uniref:hypothetical protein n=1 Tax=Streptomyces noursei TaxID=1971 RepID=UPI0019CBAA59|nr:hypothetical protein [Streptomyces noursei]MCZ1015889.1 hypothetical protein [Streptomyces noursei]GGW91494.1 hypothetical protein GCM10010341_10840 [Streptomyces noursei]
MWQPDDILMTQKIAPLVNRYVFTLPESGEVIAFAEQKRFALQEQLTLWTDEDRSRELGGFKAREVIDLGATYDVTGTGGDLIGSFRKDFKASFLRSTWHLTQGKESAAVGKERRVGVALARRAWDVVDLVVPLVTLPPYPGSGVGPDTRALHGSWAGRPAGALTVGHRSAGRTVPPHGGGRKGRSAGSRASSASLNSFSDRLGNSCGTPSSFPRWAVGSME